MPQEVLSLRLSPELQEQVEAIAQREDVTASVIYRRAIKRYVAPFFMPDGSLKETQDRVVDDQRIAQPA